MKPTSVQKLSFFFVFNISSSMKADLQLQPNKFAWKGRQASRKAYIPLGLYNSSCPLLICYRTNRRGGGNTRGRCEGKKGDRYCGPPGARVTYARVNWSASPTSFCTKSCSGNAVTFLCATPSPVCVLKRENREVPHSIVRVASASRFSTKKRLHYRLKNTAYREDGINFYLWFLRHECPVSAPVYSSL